LVEESKKRVCDHGPVPVGGVAVTTAGKIPGARKVIHAVGPMVPSGQQPTPGQRDELASAIWNSLMAASEHRLQSLAVPAISTGVYNFPLDEATQILVEGAAQFALRHPDTAVQEVRFVGWEEKAVVAFEKALAVTQDAYTSTEHTTTAPPMANKAGSGGSKRTNTDTDGAARGVDNRVIVGACDADVANFKAGGVLMYKIVSGEIKLLVGLEHRAEGKVLNFLGGKRDVHSLFGVKGTPETVEETAVREFCEESGGVVKESTVRACLADSAATRIWFGPGKYVLYVTKCPDEHHNMDKDYNALPAWERGAAAEMDSLVWVRWSVLAAALAKARRKEDGQSVHYETRVWRKVMAYELSELMRRLLRGQGVAALLDGLLSGDHLGIVLGLIDEELNDAANDKFDLAANPDWKMRLKLPEVPEFKPSIADLPKSDPQYQALLQALPDTYRARVYSIRKVNVQNRITEHQAEEAHLRLDPENKVQVIPRTIHGTPERWRATNIAFKGFDLSIVLNGRASGNGVYSATDVNIPLGYCKQAGSLIVMRGVLTSKDVDNNPIYVFRGAKQVLPVALIDFAGTEGDAQACEEDLRRAQAEAARRCRAEIAEVKAKEERYVQEARKRHADSLACYTKRLQAIATELAALPTGKGGIESAEEVRRRASLCRRFEVERQQYHAHPRPAIYPEKNAVIQALRDNDVVVIFAGTGSGKSTQVPQYLLDDVLDPSDRRRVAVLQPRRFNAISLCERVSKERGQSIGTEIGYSLGQGDICVTPGTTRIEFMTHGLFINRAMDPDKLMDQYAAVILDEAHERSTDVDLCFALLRKALQRASTPNADGTRKTFKVVVASATVSESNLKKFAQFLTADGLGLRSRIFQVKGNAFPVLVLHRPEAEPDWKQANILDAARSLASYALEIAIGLIKQRAVGNVLIFMPGEAVITRCMDSLKSWSMFSDTTSPSSVDKGLGSGYLRSTEDYSFQVGVDGTTKGRKELTVGVYPFHSKVTDATRQKMLDHKAAGQDLIIIFCTNAAETGLTLPNIQHVIDTGLERRVVWNSVAGIKEMRTVQITKSSMTQRAGRAGRVCSGICVRLYSEETEQGLEEEPAPAIESAEIPKTVLMIHSRRQLGEQDELTMLTEIPSANQRSAEAFLQQMGALDTHNVPTALGENLLRLGLPLRLGKFLLACHDRQCLAAATDIAAMLTVTSALSLLPRKGTQLEDYEAREFLDYWGDHFTLLNILRTFRASKKPAEFCAHYGLDFTVLEDVERAKLHLETVCLEMQLSVTDSGPLTASPDALRQALRQALCSAHFDQILSFCNPGDPRRRFKRVLPDRDARGFLDAAAQFSVEVGLNKTVDPANPNSLTTTATPVPGTAPVDADDAPQDTPDSLVALQHQSAVWCACEQNSGNGHALAVFDSIIMTDSSRGGIVQCVSVVTKEDVEAGAKSWCSAVGFDRLVSSIASRTEEFQLGPKATKCLITNGGQLLRQYVNRFSVARGKVDNKAGVLRITAPQYWLENFRAQKLPVLLRFDDGDDSDAHDSMGQFSLSLAGLDHGQVGQVINRIGAASKTKKTDFLNVLNKMLSQAGIAEDDSFRPIVNDDLRVDSKSKPPKVLLNLHGPATQFASVLMGALQTEVASIFGDSRARQLKLNAVAIVGGSALGGGTSTNTVMSNLTALSSQVVPRCSGDRASAMLYIAHAVIWRCPCKIYGGFVRDFVVRNEAANDVDVAFEPTKVALADVKAMVIAAAAEIRLKVAGEKQKGQAYTITLAVGAETFDVDLVDQVASRRASVAPGVDCDVGNLMVQAPRDGQLALSLKVPNNQLVSLSESQRHCRDKKFVFYYHESNDASTRRLDKYFKRGWTCVNVLEGSLLAVAQQAGSLYQPQAKYSKAYHTLQPPGTN
jgi:HrpA-like RNA helicase/O-acetyl-ADP-ribose deacetylase (regulator of RNase III)